MLIYQTIMVDASKGTVQSNYELKILNSYLYCSSTLCPHMGGLTSPKPVPSVSDLPRLHIGFISRFRKSQWRKGAAEELAV